MNTTIEQNITGNWTLKDEIYLFEDSVAQSDIEDILKNHFQLDIYRKFDPTIIFPNDVFQYILGFLRPKTIGKCVLVSKNWFKAVTTLPNNIINQIKTAKNSEYDDYDYDF